MEMEGIELINMGQAPMTKLVDAPLPISLMSYEELCTDYLHCTPDPARVAEDNEANERWYQEHPWIRENIAKGKELMIRLSQPGGGRRAHKKGEGTGYNDDNGKAILYGERLTLWKDGQMHFADYFVDRWGRAYNPKTYDALPLDEYLDDRKDEGYSIIAIQLKA